MIEAMEVDDDDGQLIVGGRWRRREGEDDSDRVVRILKEVQ